MKGIIFTEFFNFVEGMHGDDFLDDLIEESLVPNDGAYTSVGTYPFSEMQQILTAYCKMSGTTVPVALNQFGANLCRSFQKKYSTFFREHDGLSGFLSSVHNHMHVEVKKLYPEAELPELHVTEINDSHLKMVYLSCRPLSDLAQGLIEGAAEYYQQPIEISRKPWNEGSEQGCEFTISYI